MSRLVCNLSPNGTSPTPIRENPHDAATSHSEQDHTETNQGHLHRILPGSYISLHSLRIYHERPRCDDGSRERRPVHRPVPVLGLAPPRGVADNSSYRGSNHEKCQKKERGFEPDGQGHCRYVASLSEVVARLLLLGRWAKSDKR